MLENGVVSRYNKGRRRLSGPRRRLDTRTRRAKKKRASFLVLSLIMETKEIQIQSVGVCCVFLLLFFPFFSFFFFEIFWKKKEKNLGKFSKFFSQKKEHERETNN